MEILKYDLLLLENIGRLYFNFSLLQFLDGFSSSFAEVFPQNCFENGTLPLDFLFSFNFGSFLHFFEKGFFFFMPSKFDLSSDFFGVVKEFFGLVLSELLTHLSDAIF